MNPGMVSAVRALPIDATLLSAVLLRLRRDVASRYARWTLGSRGAMEMDIHFAPRETALGLYSPVWATTARLWDPAQLAVAAATVELEAKSADLCELRLTATDLTPWWQAHRADLDDLAHAAVDELAEEMLWHATRRDISVTEA